MKTLSSTLKNKSGQTVIEFALVSVLFVFMLVVTFNGILAFGTQQYLSYVAFMSARAYQAAGQDPREATAEAIAVIRRYIPSIPLDSNSKIFPNEGFPVVFEAFGSRRPVAFIKRVFVPVVNQGDYASFLGLDRDANANTPQSANLPGSLPTAVEIDFKVPFAQLPLGEEVRSKLGLINMYAQSFLGRQVSRQECLNFFKFFLKKYQIDLVPASKIFSDNYYMLMDDNGC